jgi:hypothetical protein
MFGTDEQCRRYCRAVCVRLRQFSSLPIQINAFWDTNLSYNESEQI